MKNVFPQIALSALGSRLLYVLFASARRINEIFALVAATLHHGGGHRIHQIAPRGPLRPQGQSLLPNANGI